MKFRLIIDKTKEEEVVATVRERSVLTDRIEQLPLPMAIAAHAVVLYLDYLLMYLLNNWIPRNGAAIGIFSAVFAVGFALIWIFIYCFTKNQTAQLNRKLPRAQ